VKNISHICFFMLLAFIFLGCEFDPMRSRTRIIEREDGWFQFYTNDSSWHGEVFRLEPVFRNPNPYFPLPPDAATPHVANIFEIEVKKVSGNRLQGFGMIFGEVVPVPTEPPAPPPPPDGRHFFVNINANGQYLIGRRNLPPANPVPGDDTDNRPDQLIPGRPMADSWIDSPRLHRGFNRINTIRVERIRNPGLVINTFNTYRVYFNGYFVDQFTDPFINITGPATPAGATAATNMINQTNTIGFRASVGTAAQQAFPNTPVDVRFRILTLPPDEPEYP